MTEKLPQPIPREINLRPVASFGRGYLTFLETHGFEPGHPSLLPFRPERIFWIYDVPKDVVRGEHAHKHGDQIFICAHGTILVETQTGRVAGSVRRWVHVLQQPTDALYVPAGLWVTLRFRERHSVLFCLAPDCYDEGDYIRKWDEYMKWFGEKYG